MPVSRLLRITAVPLMLVAGGLLAVQSEINGRLAVSLGGDTRGAITAATISFGSGFLWLALVTLGRPRHRQSVRDLVAAVRARQVRPVELVGGCFGAYLVTTQGLTVATIGVALFSVALTAGQSASALAVDHHGLGPSGRNAFSAPRAVAAAFAVAAVLVATGERLVDHFSAQVAIFALLPFVAGVGLAVQQAINGRVTAQVGAWTTTLNNFGVGTVVLVVVLAVILAVRGLPPGLPTNGWLYVGGALGIGYIWLCALLVHVHGVLVLGLCVIAGQVTTAQAIELTVGALGSGDAHVGAAGIAAGVLTVVGVVAAFAVRPKADALTG